MWKLFKYNVTSKTPMQERMALRSESRSVDCRNAADYEDRRRSSQLL